MLGVCLGHQALAAAFGGKVVRGEPVHGKTAEVEHDGRTIFEGLPSPLTAGRYHSLIVDPELPDTLEASARHGDTVMAIRHRELPAEGVQFHPESVLTGEGLRLLENFLEAMRRSLILLVFATALAGAPEAAAQGCGGSYRYALTVTGTKSVSEAWQPGQIKAGEFGLRYRYQVRYPRARVRVLGMSRRALADRHDRPRHGPDLLQLVRPHARRRFRRAAAVRVLDHPARATRERVPHRQSSCPATAACLDLGSELTRRGSSRLERALEARRAAVCTEFNETGLHELRVFGPVFRKGFRIPGGVLTDPRLSLPGSVRIERLTGRAPAPIRQARRRAFGVDLEVRDRRRGHHRGACTGQRVDLDSLPPPLSRTHLRDFRPPCPTLS